MSGEDGDEVFVDEVEDEVEDEPKAMGMYPAPVYKPTLGPKKEALMEELEESNAREAQQPMSHGQHEIMTQKKLRSELSKTKGEKPILVYNPVSNTLETHSLAKPHIPTSQPNSQPCSGGRRHHGRRVAWGSSVSGHQKPRPAQRQRDESDVERLRRKTDKKYIEREKTEKVDKKYVEREKVEKMINRLVRRKDDLPYYHEIVKMLRQAKNPMATAPDLTHLSEKLMELDVERASEMEDKAGVEPEDKEVAYPVANVDDLKIEWNKLPDSMKWTSSMLGNLSAEELKEAHRVLDILGERDDGIEEDEEEDDDE